MGILSLYSDPFGKRYKKRTWGQALGITRAKRAVYRKVLGPFRALNPFRKWRNFKQNVKRKLGLRSEFMKAYRHGTWGKYVKRKVLGESLRENYSHYQSDPHDGQQTGPTNKGILGSLKRYAAPGVVAGLTLLGHRRLKRVYDAVKNAHNPSIGRRIVNFAGKHAADIGDTGIILAKQGGHEVYSTAKSVAHDVFDDAWHGLKKDSRNSAKRFMRGGRRGLSRGVDTTMRNFARSAGFKMPKRKRRRVRNSDVPRLSNLRENYYPPQRYEPQERGVIGSVLKMGAVGALGVVGASKAHQLHKFLKNADRVARYRVQTQLVGKSLGVAKKQAGAISGLQYSIPMMRNQAHAALADAAASASALIYGKNMSRATSRARNKLLIPYIEGRLKGMGKLHSRQYYKEVRAFRKDRPFLFDEMVKANNPNWRKNYGTKTLHDKIKSHIGTMNTENSRKAEETAYLTAFSKVKGSRRRRMARRRVKTPHVRKAIKGMFKDVKESLNMPFNESRLIESLASSTASHIAHSVQHLNHPVKALMLKHAVNLGEDIGTSHLSDKNKKRYMKVAHPQSPKSRMGKLISDLTELGVTTGGMALASKLKNPHIAKTIAAGVASNVAGENVGSIIGRKFDKKELKHAKRTFRRSSRK